MRRREKDLHVPSSLSLHPNTIVYSHHLLPPHLDYPLSLCHTRPMATDASKTLVNTSLDLLLAVYYNVNIWFSVLNLFTLSSILPFCTSSLTFCIVYSTPCAQGYCKHQGMQGCTMKKWWQVQCTFTWSWRTIPSLSPCCYLNPRTSLFRENTGIYILCWKHNNTGNVMWTGMSW